MIKASEAVRVNVPNTTDKGNTSFKAGTIFDPTRFNYEGYRDGWYNHIFRYHGDQKAINTLAAALDTTPEQLNKPFDVKTSKADIDELRGMCQNYLDNLAWNYRYYHRGTSSINMNMYYPYHYTPLII